jgi:hypothetical protein
MLAEEQDIDAVGAVVGRSVPTWARGADLPVLGERARVSEGTDGTEAPDMRL